jgi:hypothetical protein
MNNTGAMHKTDTQGGEEDKGIKPLKSLTIV